MKDWWHGPDDRTHMVLVGQLSVLPTEQALGFPGARGVDSNWCIEVAGDRQRVFVLGCQIRTVALGEVDGSAASHYLVP